MRVGPAPIGARWLRIRATWPCRRNPSRVDPVRGASRALSLSIEESEILLNLRMLAVLLPAMILVATCSNPAPVEPSSSPATAATQSAGGSASAATRVVEVTMTDAMRFEPAALTVKRGEPITFVVLNAGVVVHEFFVGTEAQQVDHAAEMAMTDMSSHDHRNGLSVDAGETRSLTMTFPEAGSMMIGCHEIGHYDAGMSGTVTVVD
jgi:uncharacterized cupredoxin-like copper-binding protein